MDIGLDEKLADIQLALAHLPRNMRSALLHPLSDYLKHFKYNVNKSYNKP
jgi:hypothetical protein